MAKKLLKDYAARIKVVGVGGGGGNAVSRMRDGFSIRGVDFIAINTDAQDLDSCNARHKIYIGKNLTRGLGTGMNPELGRQAAEENRSEIAEALEGAHLVFVTAGLGGGTGSGASPVVAEVAREMGALTIGIVTKPFAFEGAQRGRVALEALAKLKDKVDAIIAIPNDRIFSIIQKDTPIVRAFEYIDDILENAVAGISELIALPGIVNVDFADVKAVMQDAGTALIGVGVTGGQERAVQAANMAINSPLLEVSIEGARGILLGIAGGRDLRMSEINDIARIVGESIDPSAKIIFGAYHDRRVKQGKIKVTLIATGFNGGSLKNSDMPMTSLFATPAPTERKTAVADKPVAEKDADSEKDAPAPEKKQKEGDIWDIPTFLRRKKK